MGKFVGERYYVVTPTTCLERGVTYKIRLDFTAYQGSRATPSASVLIDSVGILYFKVLESKTI